MIATLNFPICTAHFPARTYDALSQPRPGGALAPVVREGLDRAAAPHAGPKGGRTKSDPLPSGERRLLLLRKIIGGFFNVQSSQFCKGVNSSAQRLAILDTELYELSGPHNRITTIATRSAKCISQALCPNAIFRFKLYNLYQFCMRELPELVTKRVEYWAGWHKFSSRGVDKAPRSHFLKFVYQVSQLSYDDPKFFADCLSHGLSKLFFVVTGSVFLTRPFVLLASISFSQLMVLGFKRPVKSVACVQMGNQSQKRSNSRAKKNSSGLRRIRFCICPNEHSHQSEQRNDGYYAEYFSFDFVSHCHTPNLLEGAS